MRFRKAIVFILCAIMTFSLVACGKKAPGNGGVDIPPGPPIGGDETCTVTYDVGAEARAAGVATPQPETVQKGGKVTSLPTVTWDETHVFVRWLASGAEFTQNTVVNSDMTVTAVWNDLAANNEYEAKLDGSDWKSGHLYIHYKRYDHAQSSLAEAAAADAPTYNNAIASDVYGDWGLWCWPKNGNGRLFNAAKIDVSGAVYDVDLTQTYNDAGWDGKALVSLNKEMTYVGAKIVSFQIHSIKSRTSGGGFWVTDGGDNDLTLSEIVRSNGSYHWFVNEAHVATDGSAHFGEAEYANPWKDVATGSMSTKTSGTQFVQSNGSLKYPQVSQRVSGWDEDAVGYQIFIASFCDSDGDGMGDLRGIINKLDYLESLNVDVLWLTPFQSSTNYHGYDIKDYFSVDARFGTLADYRELVYKVHEKGMKIVMDFVLNHTSKSNPWFVKSQNLVKETRADGVEVDYRQFYTWINKTQFAGLPKKQREGADQQWFGPLNGNGEETDGYYFYSSFSSDMPELNYDYQPVRDAILDVCNYWMAFGLDGFRLDAVKHIYMSNEVTGVGKTLTSNVVTDTNDAYNHDVGRNQHFYNEFNYRLKQSYPNAFVVGENLDGNPENVAQYYAGIDSQFDFNLYYDAARAVAQSTGAIQQGGQQTDKGWLYAALTAQQKNNQLFSNKNTNYIDGQFTSNHDLPRARDRVNISGSSAKLDDTYYAFYTDGTMDGSKGGRLDTTRVDTTDVLIRMYYAFLMTFPGVSWIYYGDEIGMTGLMQYTLDSGSTSSTASAPHEDRVYRQPMKWAASGNSSYSIGYDDFKCELVGYNKDALESVADQDNKSGSLLNWVRTLTAIRDQKGLGKSTVTPVQGTGDGQVVYTVQGTKGKIKVYVYAQNSLPSDTPITIDGRPAKYEGTINGKSYGVLITNA